MIPSFPRWIWVWAACLPAVAGSVNATALLALRHGGVTHLTGIATEGALGLAAEDWPLLAHAAGVVLAFILGCAISAWWLRAPRWTPSLQAAGLLAAEAGLLVGAAWLLPTAAAPGVTLCAAAMGLQNGMTTLVSGAVLRTSHLTGMFTDLGIAVGQRAWSGPVDRRRVTVCAVVITSFCVGAALGTVGYATWGGRALAASAVVALGVAFLSWRLHRRNPAHRAPPTQREG